MKILMVNTFHHRRGGDATYALTLSRRLEAAGHEVVPLAMRHPDNEPSVWEPWFVGQIDHRDLRGRTDRLRALARLVHHPGSARAAAGLIAKTKPDLVHLQHVHRHLTPSVVDPAVRAGIPVVWTVHDYELVCPSGHLFANGAPCEACKGHRYQNAVLKRCKRGDVVLSAAAAFEKAAHVATGLWRKIDRFLCPSAFLAQKLVDFGVPADRVFVQPNFVEVDAPPSPGGSGWLYAGRLSEEKGVRLLVDAARLLPDQRLVICGAGPLEGELRARARGLANIEWRGHVPKADLDRALRDAAVVAVPSLWYENLPYAVAEAQAAGKAVVASRIGGIPELVDDGRDGVLVPPADPRALADAVRGLLADPERARRLGLAGHDRVKTRMDPDAHLERILAHYEAVR